jgi:hypothetical protein
LVDRVASVLLGRDRAWRIGSGTGDIFAFGMS